MTIYSTKNSTNGAYIRNNKRDIPLNSTKKMWLEPGQKVLGQSYFYIIHLNVKKKLYGNLPSANNASPYSQPNQFT